ncbi:hypothetical protein J6E39_03950 [bacterium]|nr:hypothetical protein [bacterium]
MADYLSVNMKLAELSRYAAGAAVLKTMEQDPLAGMGIMVGFQAIPSVYSGSKWLINNRGNYSQAWTNLKAENMAKNAKMNSLKGGNIFETAMNRDRFTRLSQLEAKCASTANPEAYAKMTKASDRARYLKNLRKSEYYKDIRADIENAKTLKGAEQKKALNAIEEKVAKANLEVHKAKVNGNLKPTTTRGKAWAGVKKYTGATKISGATKSWLAKSPVARTCLKGIGGNALFAAISLGMEMPNVIESYKTLGAAAGTKDLGRAATIAVAETAGFAIGAKAGGIAGAQVGFWIGSAVPGIGNAVGTFVGGLIGMGCGILAGHLAGSGAKALLGKSELQKYKEKQAKNIFKEAQNSDEAKLALLEKAKDKLQKDNPNSKDAKEALKAYNLLAEHWMKEQQEKLDKQNKAAA